MKSRISCYSYPDLYSSRIFVSGKRAWKLIGIYSWPGNIKLKPSMIWEAVIMLPVTYILLNIAIFQHVQTFLNLFLVLIDE